MEVDNHILEYISLYLDDELQNGERLAVETHIKSCADCRVALDTERELILAIRSARPIYTAPASLQANVAQLVQSSGRRTKLVCSRPVIAACALLLLAIAGVWLAGSNSLQEDRSSFRSRVNFFMNKFRKLGFIDYNGGLKIHNSLLTVVLRN